MRLKLFAPLFLLLIYFTPSSASKISFSVVSNSIETDTLTWTDYSSTLNFGIFHQDTIVIKVVYSDSERGNVLEIRNFYLDAEAFSFSNNRLKILSNSKHDNYYPSFQLPIENNTLYVRIFSKGMLYVPIQITSEFEFEQKNQQRTIFFAILMSLLVFCIIICIYAILIFKNQIYKLCLFYLLSQIFIIYNFSGLLKMNFHIHSAFQITYITFFSLLIYHISVLLLAKKIIGFKGRFERIFYYILFVDIFCGIVCFLIPIKFGFLFHNIMPIVLMIFVIIASLKTYFELKNKVLLIFLAGWLVYYLGAIILNFVNIGVLNANFLTEHVFFIGAILEAFIFILAVFIKVKHDNNITLMYSDWLHDNLFSEREKDVIALLLQGYSNQKMANALFVSSNTIKFHLTNIYAKCGVRNRSEAIAKLLRYSK